jgi:hypothetical protein
MADNYSYLDEASRRQRYSDTSLESDYTQSLPLTGGGVSTAYPVMGGNPAYASSIGGGQFADTSLVSGYTQSLPPTTEGLASAYGMIESGGYGGSNSSPYAQAMQTMQSAYGNRALQRFIGQPVGGSGGSLPGEGVSSISGLADQEVPFVVPGETVRGGWNHPADGTGGFMYYEDQPNQLRIPGLPFGIPLHNFEGHMGFDLGGETVVDANAYGGSWQSGDGSTRYGGKLDGGLVMPEPLASLGLQQLRGSGEVSVGDSGFTIGAGLTQTGLSGSMGNFTEGSNTEDFVSFGVSEGPSLGLRGHWGDSDGDGYRELGMGFDLGFASFDVKSEDPLRTMLMGGPLNMVPDAWNPMTGLLPDGNLTYEAGNMAHNAIMDTGDALGEAFNDWWYGEQGLDPL